MSMEVITYFPSPGYSEAEIALDARQVEILHEAYEQISMNAHFPECCAISADALANKGFSRKTGWFQTDLPNDVSMIPTRNYQGHGWNMLDDKIIDLTAVQFNSFLYEENRLPSGVIVIQRGNNLFQRYVAKPSPTAKKLGRLDRALKYTSEFIGGHIHL
jgi:hypothetical protein